MNPFKGMLTKNNLRGRQRDDLACERSSPDGSTPRRGVLGARTLAPHFVLKRGRVRGRLCKKVGKIFG